MAFRRTVAIAAFAALLVAGAAAAHPPRLETALLPTAALAPGDLTHRQAALTGATKVRLTVYWTSVAPAREPASWDPSDPADPAYGWAGVDAQVRRAVAGRLDPILTILGAPSWATAPGGGGYPSGTYKPSAADFGQFALAAARRYSGIFQDLPRVRYWEAWNEPNLTVFLNPQIVEGTPVSPGWYRGLVNAFADAVHSVHRDNVVIGGGLAPFFDNTDEVTRQNDAWGPLTFMRNLLCVSKRLTPTCRNRVRFDVWSTHPYTSGGPTHHAFRADDVSLGDLPEMRAVLDAAIRARHVVSAHRPQFWVTEFSWDSSPPDPGGVPTKLLKRWVPQALWTMWRSGVSLVTWFSLRDESPTVSYYQSGLFYAGGRMKPYLRGFRFPLVAFRRPGGIYVWGRTPAGAPGRVIVEHLTSGGKWKRLGNVTTNHFGMFERTFRARPTGPVRARLGSEDATVPFSLQTVPDQFFNPFGLPSFEPKKKPPATRVRARPAESPGPGAFTPLALGAVLRFAAVAVAERVHHPAVLTHRHRCLHSDHVDRELQRAENRPEVMLMRVAAASHRVSSWGQHPPPASAARNRQRPWLNPRRWSRAATAAASIGAGSLAPSAPNRLRARAPGRLQRDR